jgi:hypothetical protein
MRTYIFTKKERAAIRGFFNGSIARSDPAIMNIISRIRNFGDLASDVEVYVKMREAISTRPA